MLGVPKTPGMLPLPEKPLRGIEGLIVNAQLNNLGLLSNIKNSIARSKWFRIISLVLS
jgi:hypothetical protein